MWVLIYMELRCNENPSLPSDKAAGTGSEKGHASLCQSYYIYRDLKKNCLYFVFGVINSYAS